MTSIRSRGARILGAAVALCAMALVATGASAKTTREHARVGGTLVVALAEDPDALDPTLARTFVGRMVFLHMCEKLYDLNAKLEIVPQLASALPTISADKQTVTIQLRRGIKFNDGTALNAAAVKTSLDRHRTLPRSARASELAPVTAVDDARAVHGQPPPERAVRAADRAARRPRRDDHVARSSSTALGDRFATNPVCVGPFSFNQPGGRRPHHARRSRRTTTGGTRSRSTRSSSRSSPTRAPAPQNLRSGDVQVARPHRVDRPPGDRPRHEPAHDQGDVDRLPGDHDQHREQERARQAVRERRHAAVARRQPCDRPSSSPSTGKRDQQRRVRRDRAPRLLARAAHEPVLRPQHPLPGPQRRPGAVDHPAHRRGDARPGEHDDRHRPGRRRGSAR